jgi:short-subunit dehydrogenase
MPTIAIIGAGPILGLSSARVFGRNGFKVALVSRTKANVDKLAAELATEGIEAAGFEGDVTDAASIEAAAAAIEAAFGPIDVLSFAPVTKEPRVGVDIVGPLEMTVENTKAQLEVQLFGAINTVRAFVPAMVARGTGTVLFTTAYASVQPMPMVANFGLAGATVRYYAATLHGELKEKGVHAAHVSVGVYLNTEPGTEADTVAKVYWDAYTDGEQPEFVHLP